jgi:RHS repeat-associated protein
VSSGTAETDLTVANYTTTWYAYDQQGTVAQRFNADGTLKNVYACDAFGNKLAGTEEVYSYNAKYGYYYDAETGFYYCLHRYYDPANGRWLTEDPIGFEGGLNLYGYCGNSPVGSVDPSGLDPTVMEASLMADQIYGVKKSIIKDKNGKYLYTVQGGWTLTEVLKNEGSLRMVVYSRKTDDDTIEYAVVNMGTKPFWLSSWINNAEQIKPSSIDVKNSIDASNKFIAKHIDALITFVGHSKGGCESALNALNSGKFNAIVFNPAYPTIDDKTLKLVDDYQGKISAYVVRGEILDVSLGSLRNTTAIWDEKTYLKQQHSGWWIFSEIQNHSMESVINGLKAEKIK